MRCGDFLKQKCFKNSFSQCVCHRAPGSLIQSHWTERANNAKTTEGCWWCHFVFTFTWLSHAHAIKQATKWHCWCYALSEVFQLLLWSTVLWLTNCQQLYYSYNCICIYMYCRRMNFRQRLWSFLASSPSMKRCVAISKFQRHWEPISQAWAEMVQC